MKHIKFMAIALLLPLFIGCQKDYTKPQIESPNNNITNDYSSKVNKDITELSESDAIKVANSFNANILQTRTTENPVVDVQTIRNSEGAPIIYAVNYEQGYTLVSATKNYHPIIAMVEEGRFNPEDEFVGTSLLLSEYETDMQLLADSSSIKKEWLPYEDLSSEMIKTRVEDIYWDLLERYCLDWADEGCNVYFLYNQPESMPDNIYNRFCSYAEDHDREEYDYMECSVIVEKFTQTTYSKGPFCPTQWDQNAPFNSKLPNTNWPLGCTTIAAGQLMKYYKIPASYSWSAMPSNTSNDTLASFLKELHDRIGVDSSGGATINEVKSALNSYGYSVTKQTHNNANVITSLNNNKPVYMRGECSTTGKGHAWVCDGYRYTVPRTEYRLFVIPIWRDSITSLEEIDSEIITNTSYLIYNRMNWGWGGDHNGYYYDPNIYINRTDNIHDFDINRKNLLFN